MSMSEGKKALEEARRLIEAESPVDVKGIALARIAESLKRIAEELVKLNENVAQSCKV